MQKCDAVPLAQCLCRIFDPAYSVAALVWNLWLVLVMESTNVFEDDTDLVDRALTLVVGRVQEEGPCPGPLDSPGVMCPLTNACTTPHMIQIHLKKAKGPNEH